MKLQQPPKYPLVILVVALAAFASDMNCNSVASEPNEASQLGPGALVRFVRTEDTEAEDIDSDDTASEKRFREFCEKQSLLVRTNLVTTSAIEQKGILDLNFFAGKQDVAVLKIRLRSATVVDFPKKNELMRIRVRTDDENEAAILANALKKSYLTEVVEHERKLHRQELSELEKLYVKYEQKYQKAELQLESLKRKYRGDASPQGIAKTLVSAQLNLERVRNEASKTSLNAHRLSLQIELFKEDPKAAGDAPKVDDTTIKAALGSMLDSDPLLAEWNSQIRETERKLEVERAKGKEASRSRTELELQLKHLHTNVMERKAELQLLVWEEFVARKKDRARRAPDSMDLKARLAELREKEAALVKEYKSAAEAFKRTKSLLEDLQTGKANVAFMQAVAKKMRAEIDRRESELKALPQVIDHKDATVSP